MLSKNTIKFFKSLHQKKYRIAHQQFFVEGRKSVLELLESSFVTDCVYATHEFLDTYGDLLRQAKVSFELATPAQLESMGQYQSNDSAIALVRMKENQLPEIQSSDWVLALDDVRDPGNLGTIIRIADWYGIKNLLFSKQTADFYNPKVIQSTMGSFTRVNFYYCDLAEVLKELNLPVYGAFMDGENVHSIQSVEQGVLLMGNESNGVSQELEPFISKKLAIPAFGQAESLNVAVATAILCDNLKRITSGK
jgi:TrmH family RNA methyltransferase